MNTADPVAAHRKSAALRLGQILVVAVALGLVGLYIDGPGGYALAATAGGCALMTSAALVAALWRVAREWRR
jgi:Na+/proline symporter